MSLRFLGNEFREFAQQNFNRRVGHQPLDARIRTQDMVPDNSSLQYSIEGQLIRGGTSKGFFSRQEAFPDDPDRRDEVILELFGTPDPLHVNGLGGSHTHTSKLMLIDDSDRPGVDLSYEYAQVGIENPTVDWSGNCGNLLSAVGVFGLFENIIEPDEPETTVRIYSKNTDSIIEQDIPVENGEPTPYHYFWGLFGYHPFLRVITVKLQ